MADVQVQRPGPFGPPELVRKPLPPKPKRRPWLWLVLLALVAAIAAGSYQYYRVYGWPKFLTKKAEGTATAAGAGKAAKAKPVPVVTAVARKGDMDVYLNGLGTVTPLNTVTVRTRIDGELTQVAYTEGQTVKKDELIAQIDPRPYEVMLAQFEGQLAKDQAALVAAQLDLNRFNKLISSNTISQGQLDAQVALVKQDEAAIKIDQGQIASANLNIAYCRITSPIPGRIGLRTVDQGNLVHASDPNGIATITQLQPIAVIFTIPQDDIPRLQARYNTGKPIQVDAYGRDTTTKIASGELSAIDNQVDPSTGNLKLKAQFPNVDNVLFPNQFVNAQLLVDTRSGVVIVASAAVQHGPNDSTYVYVVQADNKVELRNVTVAADSEHVTMISRDRPAKRGEESLIEKGLAAGEVVVTDGVDKLQPGSKVILPDQKKSGKAATTAGDNEAASPPAESPSLAPASSPMPESAK